MTLLQSDCPFISAGKIHISKATNDLLLSDPDYIIEARGEIELVVRAYRTV
jgi:hypothetical protein